MPKLYGKPLKIVFVGYQEAEAVKKFKLFDNTKETHIKFMNLFRELGIEYVKCSDLI